MVDFFKMESGKFYSVAGQTNKIFMKKANALIEHNTLTGAASKSSLQFDVNADIFELADGVTVKPKLKLYLKAWEAYKTGNGDFETVTRREDLDEFKDLP